MPKRAEEIGFLDGHDVADGPIQHPLHRFYDAGSIAPAEAGNKAQPFSAANSEVSSTERTPGSVDRHRLFAKDMLAGLDGRFEVHRAEMGRSGQDHHVDVARHQPLISVEAHEAILRATATRSGICLRSCPRLLSSRSANRSARAVSLVCGSALRASSAAPLPRPPQPTSPTLSTSLPAAWALRQRKGPGSHA